VRAYNSPTTRAQAHTQSNALACRAPPPPPLTVKAPLPARPHQVGSMLAQQVEGRVATELDPRLAHDKGGRHGGMQLGGHGIMSGNMITVLVEGAPRQRRPRPGATRGGRRKRRQLSACAPSFLPSTPLALLSEQTPPSFDPPRRRVAAASRAPPPRNADALVARARGILALYQEMGVPPSKLIFRVPATWAGIQAAAALEAEGTATQVFHIYRCAARAAAGRLPEGLQGRAALDGLGAGRCSWEGAGGRVGQARGQLLVFHVLCVFSRKQHAVSVLVWSPRSCRRFHPLNLDTYACGPTPGPAHAA
jgi:hypothetical protein